MESVQLYSMVKSELESLKTREKDVLEELNTYKDKASLVLFFWLLRYCLVVKV